MSALTADRAPLRTRLWASRWPETTWFVFAFANLAWMIAVPAQLILPYHLIWISLLLLYGLGYRTWSRALTVGLLLPLVAAAVILLIDASIVGYDELIELPVTLLVLYAMMSRTGHNEAAMARLDEVSRHNIALLERQRAFVQNASHELRTPITIALAHAELLSKSASPDKISADDAAIVVDELGRLRRLADQLVLLATAEQPGLFRPARLRLVPLVDDALRRWEPTPRTWQAGRRDDVTVVADLDRLVVALDALLDNAVRCTSEGAPIELSVQLRGPEAAITVADSGLGIPEDRLESVFDRFDRGDAQGDGARNFGLGLSIVQAVAEVHGGRVTAGKSRLGGAAVTVWLPVPEPVTPRAGQADLGQAR